MKKMLVVLTILLVSTAVAYGAACASGLTMTQYVVQYGGKIDANNPVTGPGCTIGDKTFSNFNLFNGAASGGGLAVPISADQITLVPFNGTVGGIHVGQLTMNFFSDTTLVTPGLVRSALPNASQVTNFDVGYSVVAPAAMAMSGATLAVSATRIGTTSDANVTKASCLGGTFTASSSGYVCSSTMAPGVAVDPFTGPSSSSISWAPVTQLETKDFVQLTGGTSGTGSSVTLISITNTFSEIPEPGTLGLLGLGLLGIGYLARRRRNA